MPPSPIPAPLPPWARWLLQLAPFITAGLQEALQYFGEMKSAADTTPDFWRHVQIVWGDPADLEKANRAVTTFDIVNVTNGKIDSSWTSADYSTVQAQLDTLINGWTSRMGVGYKAIETRYYRRSFNPTTLDDPFAKSGPPERINVAGGTTGTLGRLPAQCAVTTTERTTYPRHWGRTYWPFPGQTLVTTGGYIQSATVDSWGLAVHDAYQALMTAEFFPVIPVTQADRVVTRGLLGLNALQVDNVFDVVRRRRMKPATHYYLAPLP